MSKFASWMGLSIALLSAVLTGCDKKKAAPEVVLYTSVDEPVARPIIEEFQRRTGIKVILKTDIEATRTAGLAERLEAEKNNPQADVWWGNEVFHTINLAERGVLAPYESPSAKEIPAQYKDAQNRYAATGLRAHVLARHTKSNLQLTSIKDLTNPALKGKICMARPTAGTTGGHISALYTLWGKDEFTTWLRGLKANEIKLVGGNSVVAETVGAGMLLAGLTDNDNVDEARAGGGAIEAILPDQKPGEIGTLTMPCTVALTSNAPHPEAAKKLVDYLLSREVEQKLLTVRFARYSVFNTSGEQSVHAMAADYPKIAANMREAVELAMKILERGE